MLAVPLFQSCQLAFIKAVVLILRPEIALPSEIVCMAGEPGKSMFFIESGTVDVLSGDLKTKFATLGESDFVGEIAILTGIRRTATIVTRRCTVPNVCICLGRHTAII